MEWEKDSVLKVPTPSIPQHLLPPAASTRSQLHSSSAHREDLPHPTTNQREPPTHCEDTTASMPTESIPIPVTVDDHDDDDDDDDDDADGDGDDDDGDGDGDADDEDEDEDEEEEEEDEDEEEEEDEEDEDDDGQTLSMPNKKESCLPLPHDKNTTRQLYFHHDPRSRGTAGAGPHTAGRHACRRPLCVEGTRAEHTVPELADVVLAVFQPSPSPSRRRNRGPSRSEEATKRGGNKSRERQQGKSDPGPWINLRNLQNLIGHKVMDVFEIDPTYRDRGSNRGPRVPQVTGPFSGHFTSLAGSPHVHACSTVWFWEPPASAGHGANEMVGGCSAASQLNDGFLPKSAFLCHKCIQNAWWAQDGASRRFSRYFFTAQDGLSPNAAVKIDSLCVGVGQNLPVIHTEFWNCT